MSSSVKAKLWMLAASLLLMTARAASAQEDMGVIEEALEGLAASDHAQAARAEIERARELSRLEALARESGDSRSAQAIRAVLALRLRLIRAILEAAEAEQEAAAVERQLEEARARRREALERLERLLERAAALRRRTGGLP